MLFVLWHMLQKSTDEARDSMTDMLGWIQPSDADGVRALELP